MYAQELDTIYVGIFNKGKKSPAALNQTTKDSEFKENWH